MNKQINPAVPHVLPYSQEQILSLAENDHFARTSRMLAAQHRWQTLEQSAGHLRGSLNQKDKAPIQTNIKLEPLEVSCSCSSMVFPCQHALALMFLFKEDASAFVISDEDFLAQIIPKAKSRVKSRVKLTKPLTLKKLAELRSGLTLLETWMHAMLADGLEQARAYPMTHWAEMSNRLFDARLGAIAEDVRRWGQRTKEDAWVDDLVAQMGRYQLLIEGFKRFDDLTEATQADLLLALGLKPELKEATQQDEWLVLGNAKKQHQGQKRHQVWLYGTQTQQFALYERMLVKPADKPISLLTGSVLKGDMQFFEGQTPYLVQPDFASLSRANSTPVLQAELSLKQAMTDIAAKRALNPWRQDYPLLLAKIRVYQEKDSWFLQDQEGYRLPLQIKLPARWHLRAMSHAQAGSQGITLFANWNADITQPLSVFTQGRWLDLSVLRGGQL